MSDVVTDVPGAPFAPVRAVTVPVSVSSSQAGLASFVKRLWARVAPIIPADHPAGFGRLDRLDRGMSTEFDGPVGHDGWVGARPTWEDLTIPERDEHRQTCLTTCGICDGFRSWGFCPACGDGDTETDDQGDSYCCGARVLFGDEADRAWNA